MRSRTTRSGWSRAQASTPAGPSAAISTAKPSLRSRAATAWAMGASSSITRIERVRTGAAERDIGPNATEGVWRSPAGHVRIPCTVPEVPRRPAQLTVAAGGVDAEPTAPGSVRRRTRSPVRGRRRPATIDVELRRPAARSSATRTRKWSRRKVRPTTMPVERAAGIEVQARRAAPRRRPPPALGASVTFQPRKPARRTRLRAGATRRSAVPTCSMRPARMIATRSASANASSWSWVTKSTVMPQARRTAPAGRRRAVAQAPVERAERLVEHQERAAPARGPGRAPRAAARRPTARRTGRCSKPPRPTSSSISRRTRRRPRRARPVHAQPEDDVAEHVAVGEQRVVLEHQPEVARGAAGRRRGRRRRGRRARRRAARGRRSPAAACSSRTRSARARTRSRRRRHREVDAVDGA